MTLNESKSISVNEAPLSSDLKDGEYSIPLNISDIISICKDFNSLGWPVQIQIDNILENGIEESIKNGSVKRESLSHIKYFLRRICDNVYFGEATMQAQDVLDLIDSYCENNAVNSLTN